MKQKRKKVLMPVYNEIDYDGRVQRSAQALGENFDVTVFAIDSGKGYANPAFAVTAVRLPKIRRFKVLLHLYFWVRLWLEALVSRPAVVHGQDFFMALPAWFASRISGAKFVYDAHELIIPEEDVEQSRRDRFFYLSEKWIINRADLVIAANAERAKCMAEHYHLSSLPLVISNIPPMPKEALGREGTDKKYPVLRRQDPAEIRLVYQGDMSLDRGIGKFVRAMKALDGRFRLFLIGGGPDVEKLKQIAAEDGVEKRVVFLGKVPRDHLYDLLKTCDVGIVTYPERGLNNILCAPNKIYEYAQAGLPMISNNNPTIEAVFARFKVGKISTSPAADIPELSAHLHDYRGNIQSFLNANSWDCEARKLNSAYQEMCGGDSDRS